MKLYREIEKTFPMIEKDLNKENLVIFRDTPIGDLCLYHIDLGMWIKNILLRPENSVLYDVRPPANFVEGGLMQFVITARGGRGMEESL